MGEHLLTNVGVYALLIRNRKLLLLHKPNDPIWCALGGRMDEDETDLIECLKREVSEEIGVQVDVGDVFDLLLWSINGKNHRLGVFYVCTMKDESSEIKISSEHDDYKFFTHEELVEMSYAEDRGKGGRRLFNKLKEKGLID